jgi:hypothetical protein
VTPGEKGDQTKVHDPIFANDGPADRTAQPAKYLPYLYEALNPATLHDPSNKD